MAFIMETKRLIIRPFNGSDLDIDFFANEYHYAMLKWDWDGRKVYR